jgi:itaconyl-CoA hydratase
MAEFAFSAYVKVGENRYRERYGLDFEDFEVGQVFQHRPGITISQQDNVEETLDTLNQAMLHFDAHYASQTEWKKPLGVSTLTLQRLMGMTWKTFNKKMRICSWAEIKMTAPVFGGDTLYAESEIKEKADAVGDANCGQLTVVTRGLNQDGKVVCVMEYDMLVYKRDSIPFEQAGY